MSSLSKAATKINAPNSIFSQEVKESVEKELKKWQPAVLVNTETAALYSSHSSKHSGLLSHRTHIESI